MIRYPLATLKSAVLVIFSVALMGVDRCPAPPSNPTQPNILLIIADDLNFDHYSFAGHPVIQTPAIDSLADQSVRYSMAYVSSTCRPSLSTFLTGLSEHRHGVTYIKGPQLGDFVTTADRLGEAGYSTYQAGKFWEGNPKGRGFTDFAPFTHYTGNGRIGRTSIQPIFDFIDSTEDPWFVWFSPTMPHSPHDAPSEFRVPYERLGLNDATIEYFAMISWFDEVVGELLAGIDDDTVVIFLADNGFVQSEIPIVAEPDSKNSSYEDGIRTQLLIRHPDKRPQSRWALVDGVDVVATLLSIANADVSGLPGKNILDRRPFKWSAFGSRSTLGLREPHGTLLERWVRLGDWKLVDVEEGNDRLHNLRADPEELHDLIDVPAAQFMENALRSELERRWAE